MQDSDLKKEVRKELLQELIKKMKAMMVQGLGDQEMEEEEMSSEPEEEGLEASQSDLPSEDGAELSEIARNGAEPGEDPAKVSSAGEHVPGESAMDELKEEMQPGAKDDAKESLRSFLQGKPASKPSPDGVTVSLIGMKAGKAPAPMPFAKKGKSKKK